MNVKPWSLEQPECHASCSLKPAPAWRTAQGTWPRLHRADRSVSQPPRGTGDLTEPGARGTPSLGSEGKKVLGKRCDLNQEPLFPFWFKVIVQHIGPLGHDSFTSTDSITGFTASLRREFREKVGQLMLLLYAWRDSFEPLKYLCWVGSTCLKEIDMPWGLLFIP